MGVDLRDFFHVLVEGEAKAFENVRAVDAFVEKGIVIAKIDDQFAIAIARTIEVRADFGVAISVMGEYVAIDTNRPIRVEVNVVADRLVIRAPSD